MPGIDQSEQEEGMLLRPQIETLASLCKDNIFKLIELQTILLLWDFFTFQHCNNNTSSRKKTNIKWSSSSKDSLDGAILTIFPHMSRDFAIYGPVHAERLCVCVAVQTMYLSLPALTLGADAGCTALSWIAAKCAMGLNELTGVKLAHQVPQILIFKSFACDESWCVVWTSWCTLTGTCSACDQSVCVLWQSMGLVGT